MDLPEMAFQHNGNNNEVLGCIGGAINSNQLIKHSRAGGEAKNSNIGAVHNYDVDDIIHDN